MKLSHNASPLHTLALLTAVDRLNATPTPPERPFTAQGYLSDRVRDLLQGFIRQEWPDMLTAIVARIEKAEGDVRAHALDALGLGDLDLSATIFRPLAMEILGTLDEAKLAAVVATLFPELV